MYYIEDEVIKPVKFVNKLNSVGRFKPVLFRRYVDDCFEFFALLTMFCFVDCFSGLS